MKVLHVIPAVAPRYGGPSHAVVGMGRALPDQGISVVIATTDADGPQRLLVPSGATLCWRGVPTIFFRRQWSEAFKYSAPLASWLGHHVAEFDVVHIHAVFSHACLAAAQACRRRGVPYIVRPLGTLDPWSLRQKPVRKRILWHVGAKRMLDGAAAIQYTTAAEQRLAESTLGLRRGVVIPLGVDPELFADPRRDEDRLGKDRPFGSDPYVLILGRLHPKKGLEAFVEVFLQLASSAEYGHWRLVVAGDGDAEYVASLKQLIRLRGGEDNILLAGWLGGVDKVVALQNAEVLALPSHQENFGLVVAEALACGTPVLVSTHVNLADEITAARAGWVVPLDRVALLETLSDVLRRTDERVRRGLAGRELARAQFTWPAVAADLAHLYSTVAA
jgi:glycosyltransferase involved in cell wall biosynthesis